MSENRSAVPEYGVNYCRGWIGFTFTDDSIISQGVAWFSRTSSIEGKQKVSHTLICTGPDNCIEAQPRGVVRSDLEKYFNDPHVHIFFRRPKGFSLAMQQRIIDAAEQHIGDKYGYGLILADLMAGSFLGRVLNRLLCNAPNKMVSGWLDSKKSEICSELVALSLKADPSLDGKGCLTLPARMVTPEMLAFDDQVFDPE